jgi:hypothetical protein
MKVRTSSTTAHQHKEAIKNDCLFVISPPSFICICAKCCFLFFDTPAVPKDRWALAGMLMICRPGDRPRPMLRCQDGGSIFSC